MLLRHPIRLRKLMPNTWVFVRPATRPSCPKRLSIAVGIVIFVFSRCANATEKSACPDKSKLKNLCMIVGSRMADSTPNSPYRYLYQRRISEAACIENSDRQNIIMEKIHQMWEQLEGEKFFYCTNPSFDVDEGSILKYAISKKFEDFVDEAITWKINLNKVDDSDQRTILDYVAFHMKRNQGNPMESTYKMYYMKLRNAGAKHRSEL